MSWHLFDFANACPYFQVLEVLHNIINKTKALALALSMAAAPALAAQHEVTGGSNLGLTIAKGGAFKFGTHAGYNYALDEMIQLGGEVALNYEKDAANEFTGKIGVGPTFNFGGPIAEAIYAQVLGQMSFGGGTNFGAVVAVGKRIPLSSDITWNPELDFDMWFKGGFAWSLEVKVVNLAVHF